VGSCRRDLLDHVIVLNRWHLKRLINEYVLYYLEDRTHLALQKGTPAGRDAKEDPGDGHKVISMPRLKKRIALPKPYSTVTDFARLRG